MSTSSEQQVELEVLESRIRAILPEMYQDNFDEVRPASMGSASLKYAQDGQVAWDEMWGSFCDLAMAGGPPHKGRLLEPASQGEIDGQSERYQEVVEQICRGIAMVTDLYAEASPHPGWIRVNCLNRGTADWLLRAITMENVSVRSEGLELDLPAGPSYRLEKEIKNVITVMAKTNHYWLGHTSQAQRGTIRNLLAAMDEESPLLQPASSFQSLKPHLLGAVRKNVSEMIHRVTGLRISDHHHTGWLGIEYPHVRSAIWMMRAMVACNVLSRREDRVLFVPLDPIRDETGEKVLDAVVRLSDLAAVRGIL